MFYNFFLRHPVNTQMFQGDSGGPGTYMQDDQHVLIGIISGTANSLANSIKPPAIGLGLEGEKTCGDDAVFCRVSNVRKWIDEIISDATFCSNFGEADVFN